MKQVIDYKGVSIPKEQAKLINNKYYKIDEDCFQLISSDGVKRWNRIDNGLIAFNRVTKTWDYITNLDKQKNLCKYLIQINNGIPFFEYDKDSSFKVFVKSSLIQKNKSNILEKISLLENNIAKNNKNIENSFSIDSIECFLNYARYEKSMFHSLEEYQQMKKILYNIYNKVDKSKLPADFIIFITGKYLENKKHQLAIDLENLKELQDELKKTKDDYFEGYCKDILTAYQLGGKDFYLKGLREGTDRFINCLFLTDKTNYKPKKGEMLNYRRAINYNANTESSTFNDTIYSYYSENNTNRKLDPKYYQIARLLKGITVGVELETAGGGFMEKELDSFGIIPLKDGSISGWEYATVPYGYKTSLSPDKQLVLTEPSTKELAKDLKLFLFACDQLSKKVIIDPTCSMHIHIGNIRQDKLFLIAFYMLCFKLQDELFSMQPFFKVDAPRYLGLKKNYCDKLPDLGLFNNCIFTESAVTDEVYCDNVLYYYNILFKFLSNGASLGPKFNRIRKVHPLGKKWERTERYKWINLVNCVFNNNPTIEFRLHGATTNPHKILNWLLICNAMIKFTENNMKEIISDSMLYNLDTVIKGYCTNFRSKKQANEFGTFTYEYLSEYIRERKAFFEKINADGDVAGKTDCQLDAEYKYSFKGECLI